MLLESVCYRHLHSLFGAPKGTINRKKVKGNPKILFWFLFIFQDVEVIKRISFFHLKALFPAVDLNVSMIQITVFPRCYYR